RVYSQSLRRFADARRFMPQGLHQAQYTITASRSAEQHRTNDPVTQFLGEIVEYLVARRLDVLEQLFHQLIVMISQRLQHRETRFFLAIEIFAFQLDDFRGCVFFVDIGAFEREIDEAGNDIAVPNRNLPQQQRYTRRRLQQLDGLANAFVGLVDFVEENEARNILIFQLAQDQLQLRHFLFV